MLKTTAFATIAATFAALTSAADLAPLTVGAPPRSALQTVPTCSVVTSGMDFAVLQERPSVAIFSATGARGGMISTDTTRLAASVPLILSADSLIRQICAVFPWVTVKLVPEIILLAALRNDHSTCRQLKKGPSSITTVKS